MSTVRRALLMQLESAVRKLKALEEEEVRLRVAIGRPREICPTGRTPAVSGSAPAVVRLRTWRGWQIH